MLAAKVVGARVMLARPTLHAVIMEINAFSARYARSDAELLSILASHGFEQ